MYKNILIPIVFDEKHDTNASYIAARALADEDAKFTVIHVMEAMPSSLVSQMPPDLLAKARSEVEASLAKSASALPEATPVLKTGQAGHTIVHYANENDIDCVVIASHIPGIENFFLGSTADRVVRHARCSVHVIR